jgi:hypothetical protein
VTRADPSKGGTAKRLLPYYRLAWLPTHVCQPRPPRRKSVRRTDSPCAGHYPSRTWNLKISGVPKSVKLLELSLLDTDRSLPAGKTLGKCLSQAASHLGANVSPPSFKAESLTILFSRSVRLVTLARAGEVAGRPSAPRALLRNSSRFGSCGSVFRAYLPAAPMPALAAAAGLAAGKQGSLASK